MISVKERKGFTWDFLYGTFSIIIGFVVILVFLSSTGAISREWTGGILGKLGTFETIRDVTSSIATGIFNLVAPTGVDENTKYIALGLFLLVWVIGSYSLANVGFFGPVSAFFVSGIVAMIGSRSLTKEIIERSNLAAGPLTAALLVLAAFPIIMVKGMMDKIYGRKDVRFFYSSKKDPKTLHVFVWKNGLSRFAIWILLAFIYYFVVDIVLKSPGEDVGMMSWVYGFCALLFGIFDTFKYVQRRRNPEKTSEDLGRMVASIRGELDELKAVARGANQGAAESVGAGPLGGTGA